MRILKSILFVYVLLILVPVYSQVKTEALIISGQVVTEKGDPVRNAHVYIIDGEEEALTNANGEFSIRSWQKAPLKITVEKPDLYHKTSITVTDPARKQVIRLKTKS